MAQQDVTTLAALPAARAKYVGAAFAAKKLGLHLWLLWNGMTTAAKKSQSF
jgi:hypothetical protein